ncbi:keratocan-like isoform X1 [Sinocyclocheilus rhinocerous]|uniref:keratocan-like isoform X1 n=2 Tax=Sinocyclocheilus rhinocerous TaxID=307959 RepID=UPI0007BAB249|nr:PREDICTED: keratocan-like isoform X1 [Sinocyclocheilus rhinocerous]
MSKVWPWGSYTTNNSNLIRLCLLMHVRARKKVGETAGWTQTGEESRRTKRLTATAKPEPDTSPPPAQNKISSMTEMSRLNLTMEWLMVAFVTLLLAGQVSSEEIPYEHLMSQIQACPKECRCPPSFPNAVYCDNTGLKRIPVIPPYTWYLYLQNNLIDVLSANALRNATQLRWINLNRNKITSEGLEADALKAMSNLVHLYMEDNLLSSIPSSLPAKLQQLRLSRNRISNIPPGVFSGMDHLTLLDLQGNKLQDDAVTEVSLKGLNNLIQINLAKNQLNTMPLGLPPTTTQIFLDSNNIEKIPAEYFKGLPKVVSLRLNRNKLANGGIPKNVFNLSSILDLQLSHNQLTEIPVISSGLEHLHLDHNKIKSVNSSDICPPDALHDYLDEKSPRLRYLRLDGNEIKPPIPRELMMCFRLLRAIVI